MGSSWHPSVFPLSVMDESSCCLGTSAAGDFNPVQFIVDEMIRIAYEDKSGSLADLLAQALRHERTKPESRRLQFNVEERPNVPASLIPEDAFLCPGVADCPLPRQGVPVSLVTGSRFNLPDPARYFQNNRKCDCPETCADEELGW